MWPNSGELSSCSSLHFFISVMIFFLLVMFDALRCSCCDSFLSHNVGIQQLDTLLSCNIVFLSTCVILFLVTFHFLVNNWGGILTSFFWVYHFSQSFQLSYDVTLVSKFYSSSYHLQSFFRHNLFLVQIWSISVPVIIRYNLFLV